MSKPMHSVARKTSHAKKRKTKDVSAPVHVSDEIVYRSIWDIEPSPENDKLYKPIDRADPDFLAFVERVRVNGITDALIITIDGYLCSGHKRFAAAWDIGLETVPCRTANIYHDDPRFLPFLRDCNRQRVKTMDEVLREEIVSAAAKPDEAYEELRQHREQAAKIQVVAGVIEGVKHRAAITQAKEPFLAAIDEILERLRDFWPLSDRLIHYQLLNNPPLIHASKPHSTYRNDLHSYKALTELLTRARIFSRIDSAAIHDPTRLVKIWRTHNSVGAYIREELDAFLGSYWRNLQASQPCHIEIVGEKNTLGGIIRPVAQQYGIPYTLARGYSSIPPRQAIAQRFRKSGKESLALLVLSDFDPEGEDIPHSLARSLRDDFLIASPRFIKVGLTAEQVRTMNLPPGLTAKEEGSRHDKFVAKHGEHVFELEAVAPEELQTILRQTIESVLDMRLFRAEQDAEIKDAAFLKGVRKTVLDALATLKLDQLGD